MIDNPISPMVRLLLGWCFLILIAGCDGEPSGSQSDPAPGPDPQSPAQGKMEQFAAHRFVQTGEEVDLRSYGTYLENGSLDERQAIEFDEENLSARCISGGIGWIRFRYRETSSENRIQTLLVICIDEVGDCSGFPRIEADLEEFRDGHTSGASDMLSAGSGELYAVCSSGTGIRLQQPIELPPLMYRVVDAWGDGPYSVQGDELEWLRQSRIVNYSGAEHQPAWIATIGRETESIDLHPDGRVEPDWLPCSQSPGCPDEADWVQDNDMIIINFGAPDLAEVVAGTSQDVRESFAESHIPGLWDQLEGLGEVAPDYTQQGQLLYRLIGLELMDQLIESFNEQHQLGSFEAKVGFDSFWQARSELQCLPDDQAACNQAEQELGEYEQKRVNEWRDEGLEIWWTGFLGYDSDGNYRPLSKPEYETFDGAFLLLDVAASANPEVDRSAALSNSIRTFGAEAPASYPLAFSVHWGPLEHVLEIDGFCEAEICPSAFSRYFEAFEPVILAIKETFQPGRVTGLGIPIFDGAHFDIQSPYEETGGVHLNRAGETGFNNPLMNLYYGR